MTQFKKPSPAVDSAEPSGALVSVVIPAFNAEAFIARALASVLAQTWRPLEIIVVDDGSTDGTRRVVESMEGPIRYFWQENAGPSAARNLGIEKSKGAYVALLDADDEWLPERLEKTLAPMEADARIGLCYCQSLMCHEDGSEFLRGAQSDKYCIRGAPYPPPRICTPAATFRRDCFEKCGAFDTELPFMEDIDLYLRVAERFKVLEIPEILVRVHERAESLSQQSRRIEERIELRLRIARRVLERGAGARKSGPVMAAAYLSSGIQCLERRLLRRAFDCFLKSFCLCPNRHSLGFMLRTFFPEPLARWAKRMRINRQKRKSPRGPRS